MPQEYTNINFEVLKGCHLKCEGCFVNKKGALPLTTTDLDLLERLTQDLQNSQQKLYIAFIGPTDFLISDNTLEILSNKAFLKILKRFTKVSFQTTFLDFSRAEEVAKEIEKNFQSQTLEINIVLDPNKLDNQKYLKTIKERKILFNTMINKNDIETFGILNIFDYENLRNADYNSYLKLHEAAEGIIETGIDFNLSLSRSPIIKKETYSRYSQSVKQLHEKIKIETTTDAIQNDIERQYNFSSGQFYYSPLFYERVSLFNEHFKIPKEFISAKGLLEFESIIKNTQKEVITKQKDCHNCNFQQLCIQRGVIFLMNYIEDPSCYLPRESPHFIYQMGTLPL